MYASQIHTTPLTQDAYRSYGAVIAARSDITPSSANMGTAQRFNRVGKLENLRQNATPNVCVFRSSPFKGDPFEIKLLEKHPHSTQAFVPMNCSKRYLVVVCNGLAKTDEPDLNTLRAFIASPNQGITYLPGVWHHPLIALDEVTDFACVVWEDDTAGDCVIKKLVRPIEVLLS